MDGLERINWRHTKTWKELEVLKDMVPSFQGRSDLKAYLKWEMKTNQVFACYQYKKC